jgi:hypothetical protein
MPVPRLETLCFRAIDQQYPDLIAQAKALDFQPRYALGSLRVYDQVCSELPNLPALNTLEAARRDLEEQARTNGAERRRLRSNFEANRPNNMCRIVNACPAIGGFFTYAISGTLIAWSFLSENGNRFNPSGVAGALELGALTLTCVAAPTLCLVSYLGHKCHSWRYGFADRRLEAQGAAVCQQLATTTMEAGVLQDQHAAYNQTLVELDEWLNRD